MKHWYHHNHVLQQYHRFCHWISLWLSPIFNVSKASVDWQMLRGNKLRLWRSSSSNPKPVSVRVRVLSFFVACYFQLWQMVIPPGWLRSIFVLLFFSCCNQPQYDSCRSLFARNTCQREFTLFLLLFFYNPIGLVICTYQISSCTTRNVRKRFIF